ncbi:reactive chlorine species resistance protein RclC, partial [Shigella flexneri]|nr:reactive chlorine species resistance protein RclC [Shigella flexneri]
GGLMAYTTPLVTLSFLITTPEAWVPALGDAHHGFPYLSGAGRLVLKDTLMLAGAVMIMADSAREILKQRSNESSSTLKTEY